MNEQDLNNREPMLEMFIFETLQLIEQLEEMLIDIEKSNHLSASCINEIFRIMHTIKGASAMMMYDDIAHLAHALEDLFASIRSGRDLKVDCVRLTDIVLQSVDFIKAEIAKVESNQDVNGKPEHLISQIKQFLAGITPAAGPAAGSAAEATPPAPAPAAARPAGQAEKPGLSAWPADAAVGDRHRYIARIFFEDGCQMENMRAYTVVHALAPHVLSMDYQPADIADNEQSSDVIRETGFQICFISAEPQAALYACLDETIFLDRLEFELADLLPDSSPAAAPAPGSGEMPPDAETAALTADSGAEAGAENRQNNLKQSIISVNINKLDQLMDLVGELVIAEAMVTRNPELEGVQLDSFHKAARQLNKLTNELQDIVMSIRMIPVAATFHKMQRIVRDMNRKLGKDVELTLGGEETEVDKSIIDHLSDPLMHLIRNALDHGIESPEERLAAGKPEKGNVWLEARNSGGDVWITIRDDGRGLDKAKILSKARQQGLLTKNECDYTEKEIFSFILLPGFSTKDTVSEYSGRGVGMDVVRENIAQIGGSITLDSTAGAGTTILIRIPLTLAIIDGMLIAVGQSRYIIPTTAIRESFRIENHQIITDTLGNELLMLRGDCYNVARLHRQFDVPDAIEQLPDGIIIVVEDDSGTLCLFADELVGEQQVVVKPLPAYLKKSRGLAGCTILGDGSISLILDISGLIKTH